MLKNVKINSCLYMNYNATSAIQMSIYYGNIYVPNIWHLQL